MSGSSAPESEAAIVLRNIKLGDSSKIVTALTPRYGRIKVVAKGARRLESRLGSLLEPGNEVELLVYVREGRDLWTLGDASLRRAALTGGNSLDKLSHLFAALELADRLLPEQQPSPEFENLYRAYLDRWHHEADEFMAPLFFGLELSVLDCLGVRLDAEQCGSCGAALSGEDRASYRVEDGVILCPRCASASAGRWLDRDTLALLGRLRTIVEDDSTLAFTERERSTVGRLLHEHMSYHLHGYRLPRALFWLAPDRGDRGRETT